MSDRELFQHARQLADGAGGGWLPLDSVKQLVDAGRCSMDDLMPRLLPLARGYAQAPLSKFEVGAVGLGSSGALYFGANLELVNCPLTQGVHAEQAVVVNAFSRQETGLTKLAVSAPPCGFCRQFLYELAAGADLEIVLADELPRRLSDLLPAAFGPADLGKTARLLEPQQRRLAWADFVPANDAAAQAAFEAAAACYAPYSEAIGAVALTLNSGELFTGVYLENAAFNPSIEPLQAALAGMSLSQRSTGEIARAIVVQREDSSVDHAAAARAILARIAPYAQLEVRLVREHA